jgi:hypothetical protein
LCRNNRKWDLHFMLRYDVGIAFKQRWPQGKLLWEYLLRINHWGDAKRLFFYTSEDGRMGLSCWKGCLVPKSRLSLFDFVTPFPICRLNTCEGTGGYELPLHQIDPSLVLAYLRSKTRQAVYDAVVALLSTYQWGEIRWTWFVANSRHRRREFQPSLTWSFQPILHRYMPEYVARIYAEECFGIQPQLDLLVQSLPGSETPQEKIDAVIKKKRKTDFIVQRQFSRPPGGEKHNNPKKNNKR